MGEDTLIDTPASTSQWNAADYARVGGFVPELGQAALDLLDPQPGEHILDVGCGDGSLTLKIKEMGAEVVGIDLSAPNLKLAHRKAEQRGVAVTYSQRDAAATGYPDASFDLVTATMLIHELPAPALRQVIRDTARLLRPGGLFVALDFQHTGDPFRDAIMDSHGARNNEPLLPMLFRTNMDQLCRAAGFRQARWYPFDERGAGLLPPGAWATRPEWHFPWAVLLAAKPT